MQTDYILDVVRIFLCCSGSVIPYKGSLSSILDMLCHCRLCGIACEDAFTPLRFPRFPRDRNLGLGARKNAQKQGSAKIAYDIKTLCYQNAKHLRPFWQTAFTAFHLHLQTYRQQTVLP